MSRFQYSSTNATEHDSSREETPVNVWEVKSMHANGRVQVKVIK